jgi:hypothetical protein
VGSKRNRNKKAWTRRRKAASRRASPKERPDAIPAPSIKRQRVQDFRRAHPTELDQIGVLIVEEDLGLQPTDLEVSA